MAKEKPCAVCGEPSWYTSSQTDESYCHKHTPKDRIRLLEETIANLKRALVNGEFHEKKAS